MSLKTFWSSKRATHLLSCPARVTHIEGMKQLTVLDMSNNSVNCFPTCLPLTVQKVYASHNRLFYSPISPSISALGQLVFLDISHNQLEELPEEFGMLSSLKNLQISDNAFMVLLFWLTSRKSLPVCSSSVSFRHWTCPKTRSKL